jgi:plasmid stability protein
MPTLTIRNVPVRTVRGLKAMAERHSRSMEQEVRDLLDDHVTDREAALQRIRASWARQSRRPTPEEVDQWIAAGRP